MPRATGWDLLQRASLGCLKESDQTEFNLEKINLIESNWLKIRLW